MKLSTRTEYGIRVLVALAHAEGDRPTSLAGIAKADKLPHAYIEQLVGALRRAGLVTATRGHWTARSWRCRAPGRTTSNHATGHRTAASTKSSSDSTTRSAGCWAQPP